MDYEHVGEHERHHDGCACCEHEHDGGAVNEKILIIRLAAAALLFALGLFLPLASPWKAVLFGAAVLVAGYDVIIETGKNIIALKFFDENLLMTIAAVCAFAIGEWRDGAAVMILFRIGELLEEHALGSSRKSISGLMELRPDTVIALRGSAEVTVPAEDIEAGEIIVVRPGERVPLDGVLLEGETTLDTSAITGESLPCAAAAGDTVLSGSANLTDVIKLRASGRLSESTVSRILRMVEDAEEGKAKPEKFITKFSRIYTPCVVGTAVLATVLPVIFGADFGTSLHRALTFLMVSCPCALVISVPLAYFAGIGGASKSGILFKSSSAVDDMAEVSAVVFDKTGTLTTGRFGVTEVNTDFEDKNRLLLLAAYAEHYSTHPLARSIVSACGQEIDESRIERFAEQSGKGVAARVAGMDVVAGTSGLMREIGLEPSAAEGSSVHVAANGKYLGHILLADLPKEDAAQAVYELGRIGVKRVVMLTGDHESAAKKIASDVGIVEYRAGCLPGDKSAIIKEIMAAAGGGKVLFAGDGINDAPVLAAADIGVSMGGLGTDAAIEASDVVIMNDRPSGVASAIRLAKKTRLIVRENIAAALAIKLVLMVLGLLGVVPLWLAVFGDVGVALLAILNSMRAYIVKI